MSAPATEAAIPSPSDYLAGEVRAELARRGVSLAKFAIDLNRPQMFVVRRIGASRNVDLTLEEAAEIAAGLGLELVDLIDSPRILAPL